MATKAKQPKGTKRDITIAKELAEELQTVVEPAWADQAARLVAILTKLDARRSKREKAARARAKKARGTRVRTA